MFLMRWIADEPSTELLAASLQGVGGGGEIRVHHVANNLNIWRMSQLSRLQVERMGNDLKE